MQTGKPDKCNVLRKKGENADSETVTIFPLPVSLWV
jgi:hypothetical protein